MNKDERTVFSVGAFAVAVGAIFLAVLAIVLVRNNSGGGGGVSTGAAAPVDLNVTLSEFTISPPMIDVPTGGARLTITNTGSMVHNLSVPQLSLESGDIQPGATKTVTVKANPNTATYDALCTIAGHAESGMKALLSLGTGDGTASGDHSAHTGETTMDVEAMDAKMAEVANRFPEKTDAFGGRPLEPTILPDGTKQFELTAEIVDWQVSADKTVKAWTYNGVVPGPEMRVDVGDHVKVVLTNKLPESTTIHWHGVRVPNEMDGVDPYTQDAVKPGETFTYEFDAIEPAVGMYHSHHNAQTQVPNGLAGAFLIGEMPVPEKLAAQGFDKITQRVNMVLNDAGTIGLSLNGKSFPATEAYTMKVGDVMEVNYYNEGLMAHPMHLHQPKGYIIAKDGIPLEVPQPGDTFNIAPGERYTVLYKAEDVGVWAWHCHILNHAEGPDGMFGMVTALIVEA